jgi:hypothetical protein
MMRIRPGAPRAELELEAAQRARDELGALARAAGEGRADAVRTLIMSVTPAILRTVRGVLGTAHPDVEDVAQESVWRSSACRSVGSASSRAGSRRASRARASCTYAWRPIWRAPVAAIRSC